MARENLTDKRLKNLKPAEPGKRYDIQDAIVPGLGVRVTDKGKVTFTLTTRFPGSNNPTRRAIGEYGAIELAAAREKARQWIADVKAGIDPAEKAKQEREAEEREANAKNARAFETMLERYIDFKKEKGRAKWEEDKRDFEREFLPRWKGKAIDDITSDEVVEALEAIKKRGAVRQSQNMAQKIGTFFNHWVKMDELDLSPYRPLRIALVLGEKKERQRRLSRDEIRALWTALDTMPATVRDVYRLLILTGSRLNEICALEWPEVHWRDDTIIIPPSRTKQDRQHVIPLTAWSREILEAHKGNKRTVFRSALDGPFVLETKIRKRVEAAMLVEYRKLVDDAEATIPDWVVHDLRRTVQSVMADESVDPHTIHAIVGHAPDKLTKTYQVSDRIKERRAALAIWEAWLREALDLTPTSNNVVRLATS